MNEASPGADEWVLAFNGGSSSLKFALFDRSLRPLRLYSGQIERIGASDGRFVVKDAAGGLIHQQTAPVLDHVGAVARVFAWLSSVIELERVGVIGHRIVHGGGRHYQPELVSAGLLASLRAITPFAPNHLPSEIAIIEACLRMDPARPQVACFDTGFHHDLPEVARVLPLPRRFEAMGVRRYGFHGLSYTYLIGELERLAGDASRGRVILAHLGAGASMAAVLGGRPIDTTMAFTPAAGLVMATRSGDIDPGLVDFLAQQTGMTTAEFHAMTSHESGLLGVSTISGDMRELLERESSDPRARLAVDLFCYRARMALGGLAAALGGLDLLVFSAGVGERSAPVRERICQGLDFLGIHLDPDRNRRHEQIISTDDSPTAVWVVPTDEELVIAQAACRLLGPPAHQESATPPA